MGGPLVSSFAKVPEARKRRRGDSCVRAAAGRWALYLYRAGRARPAAVAAHACRAAGPSPCLVTLGHGHEHFVADVQKRRSRCCSALLCSGVAIEAARGAARVSLLLGALLRGAHLNRRRPRHGGSPTHVLSSLNRPLDAPQLCPCLCFTATGVYRAHSDSFSSATPTSNCPLHARSEHASATDAPDGSEPWIIQPARLRGTTARPLPAAGN
ncbi:hypothetical protein BS50DRAFT_358415 [Corynespora cassiicola Philippines]|uniref:Uncharacterized protein n=1 Tax=Corynespora cassiicola Philippines TaxID=1448308 RepID=A0A2T2NRZ4_CORCC|nr:hypothetical protein BS50DRAFT_358415 [Corynespora cassiicola Philippines]